MQISFFNDDAPDFDDRPLQHTIITLLNKICSEEKIEFEEIRVIWVTDAILQKMHVDFMDDPSLTDVITFDYDEDAELYISVDRALAVHNEHNHSFEKEIIYYAIHGCLHLCSYDDHEVEDIKRMRSAEKIYLDMVP